MENNENKIHIGEEIKRELLKQDRTISWLARQLGCDSSNLNKRLKSSKMKLNLLKKISEILTKDFSV